MKFITLILALATMSCNSVGKLDVFDGGAYWPPQEARHLKG